MTDTKEERLAQARYLFNLPVDYDNRCASCAYVSDSTGGVHGTCKRLGHHIAHVGCSVCPLYRPCGEKP